MAEQSPRRAAAWSPQPGPQTDAITAEWCPELLYGGARGGGKTDYLIGDFLQDVPTYGPLWQGIILRRTFDPELKETMARAAQIYPMTGATYSVGDREWEWPNGAKLRLRYLENPADSMRYQGHAYSWIGFDELTQHATDEGYRAMMGSLRSAGGPVPTMRVRATANPGGPGHDWVRDRFDLLRRPRGYEPIRDEQTGLERMFIPSRVQDNKILLANDPGYVNRLRGVGSAARVAAWLDGDWSIVDGGQVLKREHWRRWGAGKAPAGILTAEQYEAWTKGEPPPCETILAHADTAYTEAEVNDPSACTVWGQWTDAIGRDHLMLLAGWEERLEFPALVRRLAADVEQYDVDLLQIEGKASGKSIIQELRRQRIYAKEFKPGSKSKLSRAHSVAPILEAGVVWCPSYGSWVERILDQCDAFPNTAHDDLVDTVVMALMALRGATDVVVDPARELDDPALIEVERDARRHRGAVYGN